jgi:hypothetical protein
MADRARGRRPDVEWVLGDLESYVPQGEFELVVMTGHAFQVFVEDEQLRSSLAAIRSALAADGSFVFEARNPAARAWERWIPENEVEVADPRGDVLRSRHEAETPVAGDVVTFTQTLTGPRWQRPQMSRSTLRFLGRRLRRHRARPARRPAARRRLRRRSRPQLLSITAGRHKQRPLG